MTDFMNNVNSSRWCPAGAGAQESLIRVADQTVKKMSDKHRFSAERKDSGDGGGQSQLVLDSHTKTRKPSMYKVLMMNDDYTPMEFVVYVLQRFFSMSSDQATAIMLNVHQRGVGVCGVYSYEVAEAKATQVMDYARQNEHPLQLQIEKD